MVLMKYFSKLKTLLKKDDVIWNSVQFRNLEGIIMEYFKWNIFIPTPTHYADLLRSQIMFPSDLIHGCPISKEMYPEVEERLIEFVNYFLDLSMQV